MNRTPAEKWSSAKNFDHSFCDSVPRPRKSLRLYESVKSLPFSMETTLTTPVRLGFYSRISTATGENYDFCPDKSGLTVLDLSTMNESSARQVNLLEGYIPGLEWKSDTFGGMHILQWISYHGKKLVQSNDHQSDDNQIIDTDFVCGSYVLEIIMKTNYASARGWRLIAISINGIIYISTYDIFKFEMRHVNGRRKKINFDTIYKCLKLKQTVTRKLDGNPITLTPNGYRDSFYLVSRFNVGSHRVLYSDASNIVTSAIQLEKPLQEMKFVMVRSKPIDAVPELEDFLSLSWWISGVLGNLHEVIVADVDENYLTGNMNRYNIDELISPDRNWSPKVASDFLESMLTFISSNVKHDLKPILFTYDNTKKEIFFEHFDEPIDLIIPSAYIDQLLTQSN